MRPRSKATIDRHLVALALLLSAFGVAMVYSAGQLERTTAYENYWIRQIEWVAVGAACAYAVSRTQERFIEAIAVPAYGMMLVMLVMLLVGFGTGAGTAKTTHSWLTLFGRRVGQPSELAKLAVVLMLAKVLGARRDAPSSLRELWKPMVVVGVPWLLIMRQPDLGTGMVLVGIFFAMLFWAGVSASLLILLASPGISLILAFNTGLWGAWFLIVLAMVILPKNKPFIWDSVIIVSANIALGAIAPAVWDHIDPYKRDRLLSFLNPEATAQNAGYNLMQSQVAIGSGGWIGKGFTLGTQKRLLFLPERHTDFIVPVIGEELGFIGVMIALGMLCVLMLRAVRIATRSLDPYSGLVAFGIAAAWCVHVLVNVGMTIGLMPITGIPLPFFSYGGSFMLACWLSVGLLVRISASGRGRADSLAI